MRYIKYLWFKLFFLIFIAPLHCVFRIMLLARSTTYFIDNGECSNPDNNTKFAIIVHGWKQSCDEEYILKLTTNLEYFRGDCVICMNYGIVGSTRYSGLVRNVDVLAGILAGKLLDLEQLGFSPSNGYMYGFSYGARIAILAGILHGPQKLAEIDVCDMAGPLFDKLPILNSKAAAKNVQCIHTSSSEGTWGRDCHQNWNMGYCGKYQLAEKANKDDAGSHGLCNIFYNAAFYHNFYAEENPIQCNVGYINPYWPKKYKMGYNERRKSKVYGELFASTWGTYPYARSRRIRRRYFFSNRR